MREVILARPAVRWSWRPRSRHRAPWPLSRTALLYERDIERLFEGFVTAAVTAIESRDPTTYGHSSRVAQMSVALAEVVDRGGRVRFSREQLRELRYAGLLHDFGKVGVREQVLVKQKKLYPLNVDLIRLRFAVLAQTADDARRAELDRLFQAVLSANEPSLDAQRQNDALAAVAALTYQDLDGECRPGYPPTTSRALAVDRARARSMSTERSGDRVTRHAHVSVPAADSVDARAPPCA